MQNEFLPYDRALKLKEFGFDEPCFVLYKASNNNQLAYAPHGITTNSQLSQGDSSNIAAPLFQQAFRWFREKYGLLTYVGSRTLDNGDTIYIPNGRTIPDTVKNGFIVDNLTYVTKKTYEEAELACLDKLIEIVELKNKDNEL